MDTIKLNKGEVKMIAHRGLSGIETENTMSAFVAAGNRSYYGIESDVHVTKDGKFVIFHDDTVKRLTGIDMPVIEECTFEELRNLTLNNVWYEFEVGEGVPDRKDLIMPTIKEYIAICNKYGKKSILEIKNLFTEKDIKNLIKEIEELGCLDNVVLISFEVENLKMLRRLLPNQPVQYLLVDYTDEAGADMDKYNLDLDILYPRLTKELVELIHSKNHMVNCWTCDEGAAGEELVEMGVDYITTNILE